MSDPAVRLARGRAALFGRAPELELLAGMLDAAQATGAAVALEGDAGIGKTALLEATTSLAKDRGFRVLRCAGLQDSEPVGFDALHELLHPLMVLVEALPPRQRAALLTAFGLQDGPPPDRLLVSLAALGLVEEASTRRPLLLAVEDLQWVDPSSASVINFIGVRLSETAAVLVATVRAGAERSPGGRIGIERLWIGPLDDESAELLLDTAPHPLPPLARARVLQESCGNPLALRELPTALRDHGITRTTLHSRLPTTKRLERTFLDQVSHIPERSRLLLILAAAAEGADLQDLMSAARSLDLSVDDLDPLESGGLLTVIGTGVAFRHPLLRSAVQGAASTAEWTNAHRALAGTTTNRVRAAWHRAAATLERDESVAVELEEAARGARQRGAMPEAARAYQRAATLSLGVGERARRLASAAETARSAGLSLEATELLEEIEPIATDPETIAEAAVTRIVLGLTAGRPGLTRSRLAVIDERLSTRAEDIDRRLKVLWGAAMHVRGNSSPDVEWRQLEQEIERIDSRSPLKPIALAVLAPLGRVAELRARLPSLVPQMTQFPLGMVSLAVAAESLQDLETALTCWGLSQELFHDSGAAGDETQALRGRANLLLLRGRLREGLADAEYAARIARDTGQPLIESMTVATIARAHALLGDEHAAEQALRRSGELLEVGPIALASADARWASGLLALGRHRYRDALIDLTHVSVHSTRSLWAIADRTEAAVRAGRAETVVDNVARADIAAQAYRSAYLTALVARSKAMLAVGDEAERQFEHALQAGQLSESPLELARTHLVFGEWLRRERRAVDARRHLGIALQEFDASGATGFADRAASELRAAGEIPRRGHSPAEAGAEPLTPQELQVAQLAAEGMTNKEIADRIYLSHRTVSTHLYRVFPKLGITGRSQLAAALKAAEHD